MKYAADFRRIARSALSGRWSIAVLAGFLAALLGGTSSYGTFKMNVPEDNPVVQQFARWIAPLLMPILIALLVLMLVYMFVGSFVWVGYARFNLDLVSSQETPTVGSLFRYATYWKTTLAATLLQVLYVLLWSLLFIIPGIMAGYSYAMTGYILAENPQLTASQAIDRSKSMMYGNRFRLFCLDISFIGWAILCAFTLGIGMLWLRPYQEAARAAFYREISGTDVM